jgi:hypothetical protein
MKVQWQVSIAKIENALKGSVAKSTAVQVAINDFETLVGTRYGQLNRQLFDFLREIERSGIVNTMVENALINRNSSELERIFCDLHVKVVGPDAGAPNALFQKMMKSFSITLTELCKDKILLEAFRLYQDDLGGRLDRVDLALVELQKTTGRKAGSFKTLQPTLIKVAKGLQAAYRSIRVRPQQ